MLKGNTIQLFEEKMDAILSGTPLNDTCFVNAVKEFLSGTYVSSDHGIAHVKYLCTFRKPHHVSAHMLWLNLGTMIHMVDLMPGTAANLWANDKLISYNFLINAFPQSGNQL